MNKYFKNLNDAEFNNFQSGLYSAVSSNVIVWNIPAPQVADLLAQKTIFDPRYAAIINKVTRTSQQVQDYHESREAYEQFIEEFANQYIINNAAISDSQKNMLGFNVRSDQHSPRPQITQVVYGLVEAKPGSQVQFLCRTASDAKRGSVPLIADGVEVRYSIGVQPATVDQCDEVELSTKSRFVLNISPADAGKRIFAYLRWRNNSDVSKSGPWSDMLSTVVGS